MSSLCHFPTKVNIITVSFSKKIQKIFNQIIIFLMITNSNPWIIFYYTPRKWFENGIHK
jgi:hypothetical protein